MKMYGIIFVGSLYAVALFAMQDNQLNNSEKILSIQKRIEKLRQEQNIIEELDIDEHAKDDSIHHIQQELKQLCDEIQSFQPIVIADEVKKLQASLKALKNNVADAEWEIED